jgi:hypothetical protein
MTKQVEPKSLTSTDVPALVCADVDKAERLIGS